MGDDAALDVGGGAVGTGVLGTARARVEDTVAGREGALPTVGKDDTFRDMRLLSVYHFFFCRPSRQRPPRTKDYAHAHRCTSPVSYTHLTLPTTPYV